MKTILALVQKAGGWHPGFYLKIDNPPYMELVIEAVDESGPFGLPSISVCQYGKQNGDAMRAPEMCFEIERAEDGTLSLNPWYFRNDYIGAEVNSREFFNGTYYELLDLHTEQKDFARMWDSNLAAQGFLDAFTDKCILG